MNDAQAFITGMKLLGAGLAMLARSAPVSVSVSRPLAVCRRWVVTRMLPRSSRPI